MRATGAAVLQLPPLMPRNLLTESIREKWKPSISRQSGDSEMMELLSTVGTTFAVGLGVVLTAFAPGHPRGGGKQKKYPLCHLVAVWVLLQSEHFYED